MTTNRVDEQQVQEIVDFIDNCRNYDMATTGELVMAHELRPERAPWC